MNFSKTVVNDRLIKLFNENSVNRMLEAAGIDAVDIVFLSLGAIVDTLSGPNCTAERTIARIDCDDIVNFEFRRHTNFEWIVNSNSFLKRHI